MSHGSPRGGGRDCKWQATISVSFDPATSRLTSRAGTPHEGFRWRSQLSVVCTTSGLAASSDGKTLWLVSAETSSLRRIRNGVVPPKSEPGYYFGLVDGDAVDAMLQHPLGVSVLADGSVAIADTYTAPCVASNEETRKVSTLATGLAEPSGVLAFGTRCS